MSRSGYTDADGENDLAIYAWQANVRRMMNGREGQRFLWEVYLALEALPTKEIITGGLVDKDGCACTLGAVAFYRGLPIPEDLKVQYDEKGEFIEPDDMDFYDAVSSMLDIKEMMAREIMYANDEGDHWHWPDGSICHSIPHKHPWEKRVRREDTAHERWQRMRRWVVSRLRGIP